MKDKIHPKYYPKARVKCACGNEFETGSTREKISVEICSACHPFYTGKSKLVDTAGRVDRFKARLAKKQPGKPSKKMRVKKQGKPNPEDLKKPGKK